MAGLLNQQQGMPQLGMGNPAPGGTQPMPGNGAPGAEEEGNVTPEEQAQYDQFVTNGMELIYNEKAMPQLLKTIEGGGDPVEGLANAMVSVVVRLEDSARDQGHEFSGDVKLNAATELMEQMVELAEQAGVHEFSEEEMESALYRGLDIYRSIRQEEGTLPVDELKQDMNMLIQADQQGTIEEVVPGITEFAKRSQSRAGTQQGQPEGDGGQEMNRRR